MAGLEVFEAENLAKIENELRDNRTKQNKDQDRFFNHGPCYMPLHLRSKGYVVVEVIVKVAAAKAARASAAAAASAATCTPIVAASRAA